MYVECTRFRHVWFWLGDCQFVLLYCHTITDILQFSFASPAIKCSPFLIAFGAFAWPVWTNQNRVCFEYHQIDSVKSIVLNITHLLMYWSGNLPEATRQGLEKWMPHDTGDIPLQHWHPSMQGQMDVDHESSQDTTT